MSLRVVTIHSSFLLLRSLPLHEDASKSVRSSHLGGHLCCSLVLAIMGKAVMDILGVILWWACAFISLGCVLSCGMAGV